MLALAAFVGLPGCAYVPALPPPEHADVQRISGDAITELSGLVKSRTYEDVFWAHNDSGDQARIFAIDTQGRILGEFDVAGAAHRDWEDIATDDAGHLYLADIGNNLNRRTDLRVYRVREPDPFGTARTVTTQEILRLRYADQEDFFDLSDFDYDAEALFFADGALWIATKHRSHRTTRLYPLAPEAGAAERALEPVAEIELEGGPILGLDPLGGVTAADFDPGGAWLALLTYRAIFVFAWPEGGPALEAPRLVRRIELDARRTRQAEALTWDGDALVLGNESGMLFRIPDVIDHGPAHYPGRGGPDQKRYCAPSINPP